MDEMIDLPELISRENLVFHWAYKNEQREVFALVARYRSPDGTAKKRFHQYRIDKEGQWVKGAPTPLPIFGIESLPKNHSEERVYIFEGEKCTTAAHHLGLPAITSMMGSGQAKEADWSILARYRHVKEYVLIPDNDESGHKYISIVFKEIQKACPQSKISVCVLNNKEKGNDIIEWIQSHRFNPPQWSGFTIIPKPYSENLQQAFLEYVLSNQVDAEIYFENSSVAEVDFECDPESIQEVLLEVLPCPLHTLPKPVVNWVKGHSMQMQISEDYIVAPFLVTLGSLIGRKRGLRLRAGTSWIEFANLWGMSIGRPSMMKSPATNAALHPLIVLADRATRQYEIAIKRYNADLETWRLGKYVKRQVRKFTKKALKISWILNHKSRCSLTKKNLL